MGKCLSCCKRQNVSNICLNESSNTIKNKVDKQSSVVVTSDNQEPLQQQQMRNISHLNKMSGLCRRVNGNRSSALRFEHSDNTSISDNPKSSPTVSKSIHFPPFFHSKVSNTGENEAKNNKRSAISLETKLNNLFNKYKDIEDEDMVLMEGVERLCADLNLQPDDFKILILAWEFNAEQMCQFTRKEFIEGCKRINADSVNQIRNRLCEIAMQLKNDQQQFKNLYRFTFKFGLDQAAGQRILPIDIALCLWKLVFTLHKPSILDKWLIFLQSDKAHIRGIPRDTWNMFLNFSETVGNDLSTYDDAEAWPSIYDDFVEYENDRLNQNLISSENSSSFSLTHSFYDKRRKEDEETNI